VEVLLARLRRDEERMVAALGRPVEGLDVLELGPGQQCERARYLSLRNRVTGLDYDLIPRGPLDYLRMARRNGAGRFIKTLGRKALGVDAARRRAWARALGVSRLPEPALWQGDVCGAPLPAGAFDLVVSWSVFEHLPRPDRALANLIGALRPGGALLIGIHLYTANNGHHDPRAFTGDDDALPPWGHLRAATAAQLRPNAQLNRLRLADWRRLFTERAPGHRETLQDYGAERLRPLLTPALRAELAGYSEEELLTVDAFYAWRRPGSAS
jgi:SAM-dependent methyltransferase